MLRGTPEKTLNKYRNKYRGKVQSSSYSEKKDNGLLAFIPFRFQPNQRSQSDIDGGTSSVKFQLFNTLLIKLYYSEFHPVYQKTLRASKIPGEWKNVCMWLFSRKIVQFYLLGYSKLSQAIKDRQLEWSWSAGIETCWSDATATQTVCWMLLSLGQELCRKLSVQSNLLSNSVFF